MNQDDESLISMLTERFERKAIHLLSKYSSDYRKKKEKLNALIDENHELMKFFDTCKEMTITKTEHKILTEFIELEKEIEEMERFIIYYCGHADALSYYELIEKILCIE